MKFQRGVALSGLLMWGIIIALVAVLGMKVAPTAIEYGKLLKSVRATAKQAGPGATVADVKKTFGKYTEIDGLDFSPNDLDISKEGGRLVISFAYEKRIPLFYNVSLLIAYQGSSDGI